MLSLTLALSLNPRFTSFLPVPSITAGDVTSTWDLQATLAEGRPRPHPGAFPASTFRQTPSPLKICGQKNTERELQVLFRWDPERHRILLHYIKIPSRQASGMPHCASTGRLSRGTDAELSSHQKWAVEKISEGASCSRDGTGASARARGLSVTLRIRRWSQGSAYPNVPPSRSFRESYSL